MGIDMLSAHSDSLLFTQLDYLFHKTTLHHLGIINPISLDVFESTLYWASQQTGKLMTMDKFGRGINVTLQAGLLLPSSLKIFHPRRHNMTGKIMIMCKN